MQRTLIVALALAAQAATAGQLRVVTAEDMRAQAARPLMIVPPVYPKEAVDAKVEGIVDMLGTVLPDGRFEVRSYEAAPDREDFKAAVRDVVGHWLLSPAYGSDCRPVAIEGAIRVWFEIKPWPKGATISVSRNTVPPAVPSPEGLDKVKLVAVKRVEPHYPEAAIRAGRDGDVEAYMRISADGEVEEVITAPSRAPIQFDNEVKYALARWKFEPRPGQPPICAFYDIHFRLR